MIAGFIISFLSYIEGVELYEKVRAAINEINDYHYEKEYRINVRNYSDIKAMIDSFRRMKGNLVMEDLLVYIEGGGYYTAEILVNRDEEFLFPIEYINRKGNIIIGETKKEYCFLKENDLYITIDGKDWLVQGIVPRAKSDILDAKLILIPDDITLYEMISNMDRITLRYSSDRSDVEYALSAIKESDLMETDIRLIIGSESNTERISSNGDIRMIIAFFSFVNCLIISEFWIMRKERAIRIKRMLGFSEKKIAFEIGTDMTMNIFISVLIVLLYKWIREMIQKNEWNLSVTEWICITLYLFLILLIMITTAVRTAGKFNVSQGFGA